MRTEFIRKAPREYVTLTVEAAEEDTFLAIRDRAAEAVKERGEENIYRLVISGQRDPGMYIDKETLLGCGMVLDVTDRTVPAFHMEELKERLHAVAFGRVPVHKDAMPHLAAMLGRYKSLMFLGSNTCQGLEPM